MTKLKLSYKKVFDRYNISFSDHLAQTSYLTYKKTRLLFSRFKPLTENERYYLSEKDSVLNEIADEMPRGFDYLKNEEAEGFLHLDYLDFYDYLPKEDLSRFIKELKRFVARNKVYKFGVYRTKEDFEGWENLGRYFDSRAFSHLLTIQLNHNGYVKNNSPEVAISLCNLSATFLVVKYRFYIRKNFNDRLNKICKTQYSGDSSLCRQFNIPWYKPKQFGKSFHDGNQIRQRKLYELISELKWEAFLELKNSFTIHFFNDNIFPPTFETYSTNIRPNKDKAHLGFWDSVMYDRTADYAPSYNISICWDYKSSNYEGLRLAAYCGGNYSSNDHLPEIAHYDISDAYAVYATACTLGMIAERDIAICNKKISRAIKKANTASLLKIRVSVERKLYHSYRFISEFSGNTIEHEDVQAFQHEFIKTGSVSSISLKGISKRIKESKEQTDNILKLLNDAAEYRSSQSNIKLQWIMMIITILSLFVALMSVSDSAVDIFENIVKNIVEWIKTF